MSIDNIKNLTFKRKTSSKIIDSDLLDISLQDSYEEIIEPEPRVNPLLIRRKSTKLLQLKEFINQDELEKVEIIGTVEKPPEKPKLEKTEEIEKIEVKLEPVKEPEPPKPLTKKERLLMKKRLMDNLANGVIN